MSERKVEDITYQEQLDRWVLGDSVHRTEGNCCPDFSCCKPELSVQTQVREAFVAGSESERMALCGAFLQAAIGLACDERAARGDGIVNVGVVGVPEGAAS